MQSHQTCEAHGLLVMPEQCLRHCAEKNGDKFFCKALLRGRLPTMEGVLTHLTHLDGFSKVFKKSRVQGPGSRLSGAMTFNGYLGRCRGAFGAILGFCEACRRGGLPALNHDLLMRISSFSSELPNILKDIQNPQSAETSDFGCLNIASIASIASTQRDNDGLNKGPGGTSPGCTQYIQHSVAA